VYERATGCVPSGFPVRLRSVVLAALAAPVLVIACTAVAQPTGARAATSATAGAAARRAAEVRASVWRYALRQRGKPYIWASTGPQGYDCSGLVYAAYRSAGVDLPRTTSEMLASRYLVRIPESQAQRGDLAFFGTGHVELYDWGPWTFGAEDTGTVIGFHRMNVYWHPTMYFRVRP
jgi:peptidoglycan DL-endopeptidase CwlO